MSSYRQDTWIERSNSDTYDGAKSFKLNSQLSAFITSDGEGRNWELSCPSLGVERHKLDTDSVEDAKNNALEFIMSKIQWAQSEMARLTVKH